MSQSLSNKTAYEQRDAQGALYGRIRRRDLNRFADTARVMWAGAASLLDVGCYGGDWLNFIAGRRRLRKACGIDVAENRIAQARKKFPHLDFQVGYAEQLDVADGAYDVVTCLEVLEHIPQWPVVFDALFRIAARQVLITIPNNETLTETVCVHCGKATPLWGHLHSFNESSFPQRAGWVRTVRTLKDRDPERPFVARLYRLVRPRRPWLLIDYRKQV